MILSKASITAIKASLASGKILHKYRDEKLHISLKSSSKRDVVTEVDFASEKLILAEIDKEFSGFSFISEEIGDQRNDQNTFWIIDPLDGTANYSSGMPIYGISIAYVENLKLTSAAIYLPETNDLYFAEVNKGAYLNNKRLIQSKSTKLDHSLVSMTFPSMFKDNSYKKNAYKIFEKLNNDTKGALRLGSSVFSLALCASEKIDAIVGFKAKLWDIAAGILINTEAGATTSFDENNLSMLEHDYILSNSYLYPYIKDFLEIN